MGSVCVDLRNRWCTGWLERRDSQDADAREIVQEVLVAVPGPFRDGTRTARTPHGDDFATGCFGLLAT